MNNIEYLGIWATVIVLLSWIPSNERKSRMINIIGCLMFVAYGIAIHSVSNILLNTCLFGIHVYKLWRNKEEPKEFNKN